MPRLRRITGKKWIGGVCAGFAYWIGMPTWLVRLLWAFLGLAYGVGILPYILLWIFMPEWETTPEDYETRSGG